MVQKGVREANKYSVFATALGGATVGFVYTLVVSIVDGYVNADLKDKPNYNHDIFYGNCGGNP